MEDIRLGPRMGRSRNRLRAALLALVVVIMLLVLASMLVPTLDVNKRQRMNEAMTAGRLRKVNELQRGFAAAHPATGYSCQLSLLKPPLPADSDYDPNAFLATGEQSGYRFVLIGCHAEADGLVLHYQVAAEPTKATDSGFRYRAFCTDDSGVIRYDVKGSAANCVAAGIKVE
jgi:hypothetical protein